MEFNISFEISEYGKAIKYSLNNERWWKLTNLIIALSNNYTRIFIAETSSAMAANPITNKVIFAFAIKFDGLSEESQRLGDYLKEIGFTKLNLGGSSNYPDWVTVCIDESTPSYPLSSDESEEIILRQLLSNVKKHRGTVRLPEPTIDKLIKNEINNYRLLSSATAYMMNQMAIGLYSKFKT
jgi:hypothetical protein